MRKSNRSFLQFAHHSMDILEYKGKFTFQDRECNKTIVDKLKELRQVALMAFKSQHIITEMPGKESGENAFNEWTAKLHHALKPILWEVCSDTYTMFKIEHSDHGNGVRDFKWKWWYDSEAKREQDAKGNPAAKHDAEADGQESPAMKAKKDKEKEKERKVSKKK